EHLVDGAGPNHAGLTKERVDGSIAGGERRRMAARRARAGPRASRLHAHDRLDARDPTRKTCESPGIAERFEIEKDDRRLRIGFPVLKQIVARYVGFVADADEGRQTDAALASELQDRHPERAALRRQADA